MTPKSATALLATMVGSVVAAQVPTEQTAEAQCSWRGEQPLFHICYCRSGGYTICQYFGPNTCEVVASCEPNRCGYAADDCC